MAAFPQPRQLALHLVSAPTPHTCSGASDVAAMPTLSFYFDFQGRINKRQQRKGQFQYRWGRKVQPKDEMPNVTIYERVAEAKTAPGCKPG